MSLEGFDPDFQETFREMLREAGLQPLPDETLEQFGTYLDLLLKWNARLNLTAIREPSAILRRHFVECIQCAQALPEGSMLLDFGSGAGFPGIPIAVCRPEIHVTLGESQGKKSSFLREVVRSLGLNVEVFDGRIETMPPERQFSLVTLRAVDRMAEACRAALARISPQGWMGVFSTEGAEAALKAALPEIEWRPDLPIPGLDHGRLLFGQKNL